MIKATKSYRVEITLRCNHSHLFGLVKYHHEETGDGIIEGTSVSEVVALVRCRFELYKRLTGTKNQEIVSITARVHHAD